ncbi:MAG: glycine cleavage system protein GcvH [Atribacterota bacterium]|nr:glycine cleavage system protein GcvH [Atribacterota bacterium]MDI9597479.1 glycine cleavage system protein GcvH [Atribacterota bacterium]
MSNKTIEGLYYSKNDEWVKKEGEIAIVGITDYAQDQLGDIVYVEEIKKGVSINKGDVLSTVESVKAVSDVYSPVTGEILETNHDIMDDPSIINKEPFDKGWFAKIKISKPEELNEMMSASEYSEYHKE